ncbi:MAG: hypothetical protein IVW57_08970 [Ktedonobacterales bacterium]|nr:hypothetical protein [Ktedonobacterales bacterium]
MSDMKTLESSEGEQLLFNEEEICRASARIAHEIVERTASARELILLGMRTRGGPLVAQRLTASA